MNGGFRRLDGRVKWEDSRDTLTREEAGACGFAAEGAVESDESELGGGGKGAQIGIGPVLSGRPTKAGHVSENAFEAAGLVQASNAVVLEPAIVGLPSLRLVHDFVGHDRFRGEEAEKTKLCEAAEKKAGIRRDAGKPRCGAGVMDMPLVAEGDPDVDIREKK